MKIRVLLWILWPSFLAAGVAEVAVFSILDPQELVVFGQPLSASREAVYSVSFLAMWTICAISSAITLALLPGGLKVWVEREGSVLDQG